MQLGRAKLYGIQKNNHFKDMNRIDGMPTEFEWKIFPGITTLGLVEKIQSLMRDLQCELEHFNDRTVIGLSWGLDQEKIVRNTHKPDGSWDQIAQNMMSNSSGSGPIFRASSACERGELRSKEGCKKSIHFNGSHVNIELLLRSVIYANQQSVYGAVADLCNGVSEGVGASGKLDALNHLEKMEIPADLSIAEISTNAQQREKLSARIRAKIRTHVRRPEIIQTMF